MESQFFDFWLFLIANEEENLTEDSKQQQQEQNHKIDENDDKNLHFYLPSSLFNDF